MQPNKENKNIIIQNNEEIINKKYYAKIDRVSEKNIFKVNIFKKLYSHKKRVKYIDFNNRLNLLATYGLDGFINLYIFPSCKLINSIKVANYYNGIFDKIFLISTPFPMIICMNQLIMYIFDINGNIIHIESIADEEVKIFIDKNCGIVQDFIIKNGIKYCFPFLEKIDS